jgi:biopolymer transport protein ExbD
MRERPSVNVMPLLDMMFILIIFFLVTTQFQQEERDIQVNLPQTKAGETLSSSARTVIVINVRADGSYVVRNQAIDQDQLREMMVKAVAANPDQKVLVRADKKAFHGYVAAAVSLCRHAGIHRANIGYELPQ